MRIRNAIAVLMLMSGCAVTMRSGEGTAGRWNGAIVRDGWQRPLQLEVAGGSWHGRWLSAQPVTDFVPQNVEVGGDEVRFEVDGLHFVGHLSGSRLSGAVLDSDGTRAGEFSFVRDEPERDPEF